MKNTFTDGHIHLLFILFSIVGFSACSTSSPVLQNPTTSATLWTQNSAEYEALTTSIYQNALSNLGLALEDSYWTAYPNQKSDNLRKLPPAVVLDVDETVLDNSAFQARMIKHNKSFDPKAWNHWVMEANADAVPGALAFTKIAAQKGITVIYLTNRDANVEADTRKNLKKLGFPLADNEDHILSQHEKPNWTSAKTYRRAYVASRYRILMFFGDDLNDFTSAKNITQERRHRLVKANQKKWGKKWYVLPNPVYGSWQSALYNFNNSLSEKEIDNVKQAKLDTKSN
ncbi:MAG TPA: HAD family acid phosphatase [Balneolaceae bacterium]|nr:HAD family acid phosphatase [Balneolaceae bacterium]